MVVVTSMTSADNYDLFNDSSSLIFTFGRGYFATIEDWVCQSPQYPIQKNYCWPGNLLPVASNWSVDTGAVLGSPVQYCLVEDPLNMDDLCGLHFNTVILTVVCVMNSLKAIGVWYTWAFLVQRKPLREIAIWNCIKATAVMYTPAFLVHRRWKRKSLISENEELGGSEESQELRLERMRKMCRWSLLEMLSNRF